jgi:hypothetical protein
LSVSRVDREAIGQGIELVAEAVKEEMRARAQSAVSAPVV